MDADEWNRVEEAKKEWDRQQERSALEWGNQRSRVINQPIGEYWREMNKPVKKDTEWDTWLTGLLVIAGFAFVIGLAYGIVLVLVDFNIPWYFAFLVMAGIVIIPYALGMFAKWLFSRGK